jgi:hypothetical protein
MKDETRATILTAVISAIAFFGFLSLFANLILSTKASEP